MENWYSPDHHLWRTGGQRQVLTDLTSTLPVEEVSKFCLFFYDATAADDTSASCPRFLSSACFYRTRVWSLFTLFVTNWLPFSNLDWCDSGLWRWQLKTCWGCYFCWCWWRGPCWQQFVTDLEAEFWSWSLTFVQTLSALVKIFKLKFMRDLEA